jgi:uncharacterized protein (DUF433 family)
MTLPGHPRIAVDPAICGGRPTVAGTRVRVSDVLEMVGGRRHRGGDRPRLHVPHG